MTLPKLSVPKYQIELSDGKTYYFRPFLVKEEKMILIAVESEDQNQLLEALCTVVKNCVEPSKGKISPEKMPLHDFIYLVIHLRAKSKGEVVEFGLKCKNVNCETVNTVNVDLTKTEINKPEKDETKIELTDTIGVVMKYPTIKVLSGIEKLDTVDGQFNLLLNCIDYIYDSENTFSTKDIPREELEKWVDELEDIHLSKLQSFVENMPKLRSKVDFKCKECELDQSVEITDFFSFLG